MKKYFSKAVTLVLSLALLICSLTFASPVQAASKKSKTDPLALVSSVTHYEINHKTKKWEKQSVEKYQYKKGYPVKISIKETYADEAAVTTLEYTFRENKTPKKMTAKTPLVIAPLNITARAQGIMRC